MMSRPPAHRRLVFAVLAVLALIATSCGGSADSTTDTAAATDAAAPAEAEEEAAVEESPSEPALVANTVSGGQIDFGSLEGQDVVLWFWAPW